MDIHWFPGHMATALGEIKKVLPQADLVLEILDARIPFSSANPKVASLCKNKPRIQILNKADLADPAATEAWLDWIGKGSGVYALAHSSQDPKRLKGALVSLAVKVAPPRRGGLPVAMVLGIPNVGKSTIINTLAGRTVARTANKPAITQVQQRVQVGRELMLLDTPGVLWPKLTPPVRGYRLAVTGAVSDRVVDFEDLASFAVRFLRVRYPDSLARHYGLEDLPADDHALLEAIGRRRGALVRGGGIDFQKVTTMVVRDLRAGHLGRITFETPDDVEPDERPDRSG